MAKNQCQLRHFFFPNFQLKQKVNFQTWVWRSMQCEAWHLNTFFILSSHYSFKNCWSSTDIRQKSDFQMQDGLAVQEQRTIGQGIKTFPVAFMLPEWLWAIGCGHSFDLYPYGISLNLVRSKYNPVYQSNIWYISIKKKYKNIRKFRNHGNSVFATTLRGRRLETGIRMKWRWRIMEVIQRSRTAKNHNEILKTKFKKKEGKYRNKDTERLCSLHPSIYLKLIWSGSPEQPELTFKLVLFWAGDWPRWPPEPPSSPGYSMILWNKNFKKVLGESCKDWRGEEKGKENTY